MCPLKGENLRLLSELLLGVHEDLDFAENDHLFRREHVQDRLLLVKLFGLLL